MIKEFSASFDINAKSDFGRSLLQKLVVGEEKSPLVFLLFQG